MDGFNRPLRRDRKLGGGGLLLYVNENIPTRALLNQNIPNDIETICIEINLRKQKWLLIGIYHPPNQSDKYFLQELGKLLDNYTQKYERIIVLGDFNMEPNSPQMVSFLDDYDLYNLIKKPTCFKSDPPKCYDLILTSNKHNFISTNTSETGLSDHHKLTYTVLKTEFVKAEPNIISYRNYKHFDEEEFNNDLYQQISSTARINDSYELFNDTLTEVLNRHAPLKQKLVRANNAPFMNKEIRKLIMLRSRAKNVFHKNRTDINRQQYKKIRNKCVKLIRKTKKTYFKNLNINFVSDNKNFWKAIKPMFNDKSTNQNKIIIIENNNITSDNKEVAEILNDYFINITDSLNINQPNFNTENVVDVDNTSSLPCDITCFKNHSSIKRINEHFQTNDKFEFEDVDAEDIADVINNLKTNKATGADNIPSKILKSAIYTISDPLAKIFNRSISTKDFPAQMKMANVSPIFKKEDNTDKKNYRPISVLPSISKIFEKIMFKQIYYYMKDKLFPLLCGFREGYSTQHALLRLIEDLKKNLDNKKSAGTVLMDLSKAFDCLPHKLLLAKLKTYGFSDNSVKFMLSYLKERIQRVKINSNFSEWMEIKQGVPQGSILGPLLFNIYINDIFLVLNKSKLCNYADDNTIWVTNENKNEIVYDLESEVAILNTWFTENYMILNGDKSKLITFQTNPVRHDVAQMNINGHVIKESNSVKLLGVTIDYQIKMDDHINKLCKEAGKKVNALARVSYFMEENKRILLMKTFITSYFNYCPLVWMFCSRKGNNRINRIHERAMRIAYRDYQSTFEELLIKSKTVNSHTKNLQYLATEIYKTINGLNPTFMNEIFSINTSPYNLRHSQFKNTEPNYKIYGFNTVSYRCNQIWNSLPVEVKNSPSLDSFKNRIKTFNSFKCTCDICKQYIHNVGFI